MQFQCWSNTQNAQIFPSWRKWLEFHDFSLLSCMKRSISWNFDILTSFTSELQVRKKDYWTQNLYANFWGCHLHNQLLLFSQNTKIAINHIPVQISKSTYWLNVYFTTNEKLVQKHKYITNILDETSLMSFFWFLTPTKSSKMNPWLMFLVPCIRAVSLVICNSLMTIEQSIWWPNSIRWPEIPNPTDGVISCETSSYVYTRLSLSKLFFDLLKVLFLWRGQPVFCEP